LALVTTSAFADDKSTCLGAASKGQRLRDAHKLVEAREQFRVCAAAQCPSVVQVDCAGWLESVEKLIPSVVLSAKNGAAEDLVDVKVSVDGQPLTTKLDGRTVFLDAGPHTFHFEGRDGTSAEQRAVIKEAVQGQPVSVVLSGATVEPSSDAPSGGSSRKTVGLVLGGAGIVGLGVGSVFGLMTVSAWANVKNACGGDVAHCANVSSASSQKIGGETDGTISTVSFVAGGAMLVGGAILYFTSPTKAERPATGITVAPSVGPEQAGLIVRGTFQ
jgi:hypothetical protein